MKVLAYVASACLLLPLQSAQAANYSLAGYYHRTPPVFQWIHPMVPFFRYHHRMDRYRCGPPHCRGRGPSRHYYRHY